MKTKTQQVHCIRRAVLGAVALVALPTLAEDVIPDDAIYADLSVKSAATYTDKDGNPATPTNNCNMVVTAQYNGNTTPPIDWRLSSLWFNATRAKAFWIDGGYVRVGEGGITFLKNDVWVAGRGSETDRRLTITADQEWKGTETDPGSTVRAAIYVGATYGEYCKMGLGVSAGVTKLTLSRYLDAWFGGQNTQMGNLDVTVKAPARLRLVYKKGNPPTAYDGWLNCHSLTLSGDGDALMLGQRIAACDDTHMYITTLLDPLHFAPVLNLEDGADISMNTLYASSGTFAIPTVNVTMPQGGTSDGVSAITGPYTVTQAVTKVTLAGNPTLDFTGATLTESGVAAGWAISGAGTVRFGMSKYALTGPLTITDATVALVEPANFLKYDFVGNSGATLEIDPGEGQESSMGDLANFSGTVKIKSGTVVFPKGKGAATIVEDGGTAVYSGGMIVTDVVRTEKEIVVKAGETLKIYGNGLTAATTVVLDGGDMDFKSFGQTVASPIKVCQSGYIRSSVAGTTNVISGFVTCNITNKVNGLRVDGYGCLTFAGGMRLELPTEAGKDWWDITSYNQLRVVGGSVLLTNGDYYMGGGNYSGGVWVGWDKSSTDATNWGKYLGIFNAKVTFADRGDGMGPGMSVLAVRPPTDSNQYNRYKTRLEIGVGATVEIPCNRYLDAGANQSYVELVLDGGSLKLNPYSKFYLGYGGYCTCDFYMKAGTLTLGGLTTQQYAQDCTRMFWYGGTIKLASTMEGAVLNGVADGNGAIRSCCQILGDDCVLDLGDYSKASASNTVADKEFAEWVGSGTLTVKGGKTCKTLVMNTFPSDVKLRLENGARVVVPDGAKVYDAALYFDATTGGAAWRSPASKAWAGGTTQWQTGGDVHLGELQVADGTATCISNQIPDKAITVGTVRVLEGASFELPDLKSYLAASSTSFENVTFDTGATWIVGDTQLVVPGTLTYGATVKAKMDVVPYYSPDLAIAGTLVGNPVVIQAGKCKVDFVFDNESGRVLRTILGLIITVF